MGDERGGKIDTLCIQTSVIDEREVLVEVRYNGGRKAVEELNGMGLVKMG